MQCEKENILNYQKIKLQKNKEKFIHDNISGWVIKGTMKGNAFRVIGIDPGVNFGFVIVDKEDVFVYYGKVKTKAKNNRIEYSIDVMNMTKSLIAIYDMHNVTCVIEGAAYRKQFGQVQLAEVRNGFFIGCRKFSNKVYISPPATIRKIAFGHGYLHGLELFPTLNANAADAIGVAMTALDREEGDN